VKVGAHRTQIGGRVARGWWAVIDSNHINICRRLMQRHANDSGKPSKRETGPSAPSTKRSVEFLYRLA
jgi:hypothetical protein